jgi:hypothetical protein
MYGVARRYADWRDVISSNAALTTSPESVTAPSSLGAASQRISDPQFFSNLDLAAARPTTKISQSRTAVPETLRDGRWSLAVEGGRSSALDPLVRFCEPRAATEHYRTRCTRTEGRPSSARRTFTSAHASGCGRRMRVTRRRCQPAGTSISASAGVSTANSAAGPKTICRRQAFACGQLPRTASIAGCH